MTRINKWLSEMGICSRKQADVMIQAGRVTVNQNLATLGLILKPEDQVRVDGKSITSRPEKIFLLYHKPVGVVCTHDSSVKNSLENRVDYPQRVFAVGRLDKDSEGLLLLTNQGEAVNKIMRSENAHQKVYRVWVDQRLDGVRLQKMAAGIEMLGTTTLPCQIRALSSHCFEIVLVQGLNRQIRRMCQAVGYRVLRLQRTHIMSFDLQDIPSGGYRQLSLEEVKALEAEI